MSKIEPILAAHPLNCAPYNKLRFARFDGNGTALYRVKNCAEPEAGPRVALTRAFTKFGGKCFYCRVALDAQPMREMRVHCDHVLAKANGGRDRLHNLVIACRRCGSGKGKDNIHDFQPRAAKSYLEALEKHLSECIEKAVAAGSKAPTASSPPRPKPASAAGP